MRIPPVSESLLKQRSEYMMCLYLADETDSKSEDKLLRADAKQILEALRETCSHDHTVIQVSYYAGSYSYDNDDWHPARRICLLCGLEESGTKTKEFEHLTRPFARFEGRYPPEIETPLKFLFSDCVSVAEEKGFLP